MTNTTAIAIRDLTKRYGSFAAVSDLTLEIEEGSICGLLGPNGAGKSTAFKCLLGLARPTNGSIELGGAPLTPATFESLAYVPEKSALYEWMTVAEHLHLYSISYRNYDAARAAELIGRFALDPRKKVSKLSKGQRTAVMLVLALSYRPRILILDEPSSGLDPVFQRLVLDLIIDAAANGATVLFSSHQVGQVERAADRVAILKNGRLVLDGNVDTLKGSSKIVEAIFDGAVPELDGLAGDARVTRIERSGRMLRAYVTAESDDVARHVQALGPRNVAILDLNLEDIFFNAVGADRAPIVGGQ
ncbi:MAG: ABC transporter ATP-binding protein [Candidatus Eremiobacteraeota bacterium]|nr:ABC transporter ATP-binding protein [Candidatus Eremiobacteraeota bacterium]